MAVVLMAVAMFVAACGGSTASISPSASASADTSCAPENLALKTAGVLTLSTDNPAYSPWFQGGNEGAEVWIGDYNNDPVNGEGYEGAVAYAIAEKLGFTADKVTWIVTVFDQAFAPGEKAFDLLLNQV